MNEKKLQSFEDIFGKIEEPKETAGVSEIEIDSLKPFHNHPFRIYEGQRLNDMVESIKEMGVMLPIIALKKSNDEYMILSGHNRVNAAKLAGLSKVPTVIKEDLSDEEAMLIVTETNLMQRSFSDMLPSEKAKALKAHHEALSKQGARTELINEIKNLVKASEIQSKGTCSQVANSKKTLSLVGKEYDLSKDTVARYIRLSYLNKALLDRVDTGEIPFIPAVSISYLTDEMQLIIEALLQEYNYKIDMKKADLLKQYLGINKLDEEKIRKILSAELEKSKKPQKAPPLKIKPKIIQRFFTSDYKNSEIEDVIEKALELYFQSEKS